MGSVVTIAETLASKLKTSKVPNMTYKLECFSAGVGIPPAGSIGAGGALTLGGTGFNTVYSAGLWLYFPAGAAYAGSPAGLYWTVMTDLLHGTVYNNTLTLPTSAAAMQPPASPVAIATGGGAYSPPTATPVSLASAIVPGGTLGKNGGLRVWHMWDFGSSATNKTMYVYFGALDAGHAINGQRAENTSGHKSMQDVCTLMNVGSESNNVFFPAWGSLGPNTSPLSTQGINTAIDQTLTMAAAVAATTDWIVLRHATVDVSPSNF